MFRRCHRLAALLLVLALPLGGPAGAMPAAPASPVALCRGAIAQAEREANLPPRLLAAIGRVESGRRDPEGGATGPWPWTINAEGRGSFFPDRAAAIAAVRALQAQGVRSIDVGCMQVNLRHHPNAFASLEEAFDPLSNARYAARFLTELQATRGDWMRSVAHYHSQTPDLAEAYRARVAAAWEQERGEPPAMPLLAGTAMPDNGAARSATLLPMAGGGRGLDAYRAQPIPVAGRFAAAQPVLAQSSAALALPAGVPARAPTAQGMPALAPPTLGLPAPAAPTLRPAGPVAPPLRPAGQAAAAPRTTGLAASSTGASGPTASLTRATGPTASIIGSSGLLPSPAGPTGPAASTPRGTPPAGPPARSAAAAAQAPAPAASVLNLFGGTRPAGPLLAAPVADARRS